MTTTKLELTRLLGSKELSFGCLWINFWELYIKTNGWWQGYTEKNKTDWIAFEPREIIWHPATITDFHRWMNVNCEWPNNKDRDWAQSPYAIHFSHTDKNLDFKIPYNSSLPLLSQSEETLSAILNLVKSYA